MNFKEKKRRQQHQQQKKKQRKLHRKKMKIVCGAQVIYCFVRFSMFLSLSLYGIDFLDILKKKTKTI